MSATEEQLAAGNALTAPPAIFDFSDASYLKMAVTSWPSCSPLGGLPPTVTSTIDLESKGGFPLADITQGSSNMCSAFAMAQAYTVKYALQTPGGVFPQLSPVYAYYLQRVEECSTSGVCPCPSCKDGSATCTKCDPPCVDCGSYLLSASSIYGTGVCTSLAWPLTTDLNMPPSEKARKRAGDQRVSTLVCVNVGDSLASDVILHLSNGNPVVVFLKITSAILQWMQTMVDRAVDVAKYATVVMPVVQGAASNEGHVVCVVGYDPTADVFIVRNSYGFKWGAQGRFSIRKSDFTGNLIHEAVAIVAVV